MPFTNHHLNPSHSAIPFRHLISSLPHLCYQEQKASVEKLYGEFEADLKTVGVWMDTADSVLNDADALPLDQQVAPPQLEKYKVGAHCVYVKLITNALTG
jgi:hypothetical protein